jgi:hypothetical protein
MTFTWVGKTKFIIDHTDVEVAFVGKGIGKQMVMNTVEFTREQGAKILPLCPFAKTEFDKNGSIQDVKL